MEHDKFRQRLMESQYFSHDYLIMVFPVCSEIGVFHDTLSFEPKLLVEMNSDFVVCYDVQAYSVYSFFFLQTQEDNPALRFLSLYCESLDADT